MTQVFTSDGLGIAGSSLSQLGAFSSKGVATLGQGASSVYINAANGNLVFRQKDGFLASKGFGFELIQSYNSLGDKGQNWCFNFQTHLIIQEPLNCSNSVVIRVDEDGHQSRFIFNAEKNCYLAENGGTATLHFDNNNWTYREGADSCSFKYDATGLLKRMSDRDGHHIEFSYQNGQLERIKDSSEKQQVEWKFEKGLLRELITSSDGKIVHHLTYDYDEHQRLRKVSRDLGDNKIYWVTYDYAGDSNRITAIRQSDGTALYIDYDSEGRVKTLKDGEGRTTSYQYHKGKTVVINSLGEPIIYFYDEKGRLTGIDSPTNAAIRYEYSGNNLIAIHKGNLHWFFNYNESGDCIRIEDPTGHIINRIYDSEHKLLNESSSTVFDGNHHPLKAKTERFVYDERGHLRFKIDANGTVTEYRYNQEGLCQSMRTYLYTGYELDHLIDHQVLSLAELTLWTSLQNPQEISLKTFHYDWRGLLDNEAVYKAVDEKGEGLGHESILTYYHYDAAGRLLEKWIPYKDGYNKTSYLYDDLGRLIQRCDNQNHYERFEYDDSHQRIIETDAKGLQIIHNFDRAGLLLATQHLGSNQKNYGTTSYHYDDVGRLLYEINVDGKASYYFYDKEGQLIGVCKPGGALTHYRYDTLGRLVQTIQYQNALNTQTWQLEMPAWSDLQLKPASSDHISQIIYNAFNQIAYQINAEGAVIAFEYNAAGQVIKKTAYAQRLTDYKAENVLSFESISLNADINSDRSCHYYYDPEGRLIAEVNGEGFATSYRYDRQGHLIETIRFTNRLTVAARAEWIAPNSSSRDIHNFSLYNAASLKIADIDPLGYVTTYEYNEQGLIIKKRSLAEALTPEIFNTINAETMLSSLHLKETNRDHLSSYFYDDLGQLIEQREQNGLCILYRYDEKGLLIEKTSMDVKTQALRQQRFRYDAMGRIIQSLDALGVAELLRNPQLSVDEIEAVWQKHSQGYDYDLAGRIISQRNALNQTTRYFYNQAGQLIYTVNANGEVLEQHYDSFNQLVSTYRYAKVLKSNLAALTIEELSNDLKKLKNGMTDEAIFYEYNSLGLLIKKSIGKNGQQILAYNSFGELEETQQNANDAHRLINRYSYDRRGLKLHQFEDLLGVNRHKEHKYDSFERLEMIIDGQQGLTRYDFNQRGERTMIENQLQNRNYFTYDPFGRILSEKNYFEVKRYSYDDLNNTLTLEHPGLASKVKTQFNAFGDKIEFIDGKGNSSHFIFDEKGQLIEVKSPENVSRFYSYDAKGKLLLQIDEQGQQIAYSYDAEGRILSKTVDPKGLALTTSYRYDGLGQQLEIIEASGLRKTFAYDDRSNLIKSIIDPEGLNLIKEYYYDERGFLVKQVDVNANGKNKVTAFQWDNLGRKTAVIIDPDGLKLRTRFSYDQNDNLISQTDAKNQSSYFVYDASNLCHYQINARGVVTEHRYNSMGFETETIVYANPLQKLANYSEEGLALTIIPSELDRYQFRDFDNLGRVKASYDALGYATRYDYDANNNLVHKQRFSIAIPLAELKAGNRITPKGDIRQQFFAYDGLNRLVYQLDEANCLTQFDYDKAGQLIGKTRFANRLYNNSNHSVEQIKSSIRHSPLQDQYTAYSYDQAGRLAYQGNADGSVISYSYNELGAVIASKRYAARLNAELLKSGDWPAQLLTSNQDRISHFIFDAAGREIYRISAEGRVMERRYDALDNVVAELTHGIRVPLKPYTEEELIAMFSSDRSARRTDYDYDVVGRLNQKIEANQRKTSYRYDANNNVLSKVDAHSAQWIFIYDEENHLIEMRSPLTNIKNPEGKWENQARSIITRNSYDSFGNIVSTIRDAEGLKQTQHYVYDANNNKLQTIYPNVHVNAANNSSAAFSRIEQIQTLTEELRYNAFGEVIASKDRLNNWRYQAYDNKGQLSYSVSTQGGLTAHSYDAFGNLLSKIVYATYLIKEPNFDYSQNSIAKALIKNAKDRVETYNYDSNNRLIETRRAEVTSYNARTKHYEKLNPLSLTSYNAFGEVSQISVKRNETDWAKTSFYYDRDGLKTACLNAENYLSTYSYNDFGELAEEIEYANRTSNLDSESVTIPSVNAKDRHVVYSYDSLGQVTAKTLKQVSYQRLLNNSLRYETITSDLTTRYSYDAIGNLSSTTDYLNQLTNYYYDELNHLTTKIGPLTRAGRSATSYSYDSLGNLVETIRYARGAKQADESGFILESRISQDLVNRTLYDEQGKAITSIDGLNHEIHYSYNANGQVARSWQILKQIDGSARLIDKRFSYDEESHLLQSAIFKNDGQLRTEDARYNAFGEVIAKGIDANLATHIDYDNLGRVWRSNAEGHYQILVYDLTDKLTQVVTASNANSLEYSLYGVDLSDSRFAENLKFSEDQWRYNLQRQDNEYDALGHCLRYSKEFTKSIKDEEEGKLEQISQFSIMDRWGNVLSHTNARGFETSYEYNSFDKVIRQELPLATVLNDKFALLNIKPTIYYAYDALGRAIAVTDANGHILTKVLDAEGSTLEEMDALGHKRIKNYDLLGRLETSRNELNGITTYYYDAANRLIELKSPTSSQKYFYDETGKLIQQSDALGQATQFWYDNLDNLALKKEANGRFTAFNYDNVGHKIQEQDAYGFIKTWRYDELGRLVEHSDLGGHQTVYKYNNNGLLLEENSTAGKSISYRYLGDGQLLSYTDNTHHETANYSYDADGNMITRSAGRATQSNDNGWLREMDFYAYDAQGRLVSMRRRHPEDQDQRFPPKDNALLSVDYFYDAVGNVQLTHVESNHSGYYKLVDDNYFSYDANNRMLINKGYLQNGEIKIKESQGSELTYDEAGNVKDAYKYENNQKQRYTYVYDNNSRLLESWKNYHLYKTTHYDALDRIDQEYSHDNFGHATQLTTRYYEGDQLGRMTLSMAYVGGWAETEKTQYTYDQVGNLLSSHSTQFKNSGWILSTHLYSYALWDGYLQTSDSTMLSVNGIPATSGKNIREFDANGQLNKATDLFGDASGRTTTTDYQISAIDGVHSRKDKNGLTNYLIAAGKTIGDVQLKSDGSQQLNIYGGFTPDGGQKNQLVGNPESFFSRENETSTSRARAENTLSNSPQDNTGTYSVQAGDTLEHIAFQVYGDSSLWYLIADANGITEHDRAEQLHNGKRLVIPAVASKQHFNSSSSLMDSDPLGDLSATAAPLINFTPGTGASARAKHHSLFKKVTIAAITVVATVIAAAVCASLAGVAGAVLSGGLGNILGLGMKVLAGQILGPLGSLGAGFTAGVAGNLAGQGLANAFGMQDGMDLRSALTSGLSTAISTGILQQLNSSKFFSDILGKLDKASLPGFNLSAASQMLGQDAVSQGISLAMQNHQHFNWYELGTKAALSGVVDSQYGKQFNQSLTEHFGETQGSLIQSELGALATGGLQTAINGGHFDAIRVLADNLGSAVGTGFIKLQTESLAAEPIVMEANEAAELAGGYSPIPLLEEDNFSAIPEGTYERFQRERAEGEIYNSIKAKMYGLWNEYEEPALANSPDSFTSITKETPHQATLGTRLFGSIQALGGSIEVALGSALTAGTAGLGAIPGYALALHGIDNILTGGAKTLTGENNETQTYNLLRKASVSPRNAALIDTGLSLLGSNPTAAVRLAPKVTSYAEKVYYTQKGELAIKAGNLMEKARSPLMGNAVLGGLSGAYGAFAAGGDLRDVGVGALMGITVSRLGKAGGLEKIFNNPYFTTGLSNLAGQIYSHQRNPSVNHYSVVSFGFTLAGVNAAKFKTDAISQPILKTMIDTMYISSFGAVGNNIGKKTGW
ncbi:MAG: hypothetical protein H0U70_12490 [Tatlockia sp.]|nr:hypothetical protein [Tatlockia sp.]